MKTTHKTREGVEMLIADMTDEHLLNTIHAAAGGIKNLRLALEAPVSVSAFERVMYKRKTMSEEDIAEKLEWTMNHLGAYVFEAALRGLNITNTLQSAFGRSTSLTLPEFSTNIDSVL